MDRLLLGHQCAEQADVEWAQKVFMDAIEKAQSMARHRVRERAAEQFDNDRIVDSIITAVDKARVGGGIETAASV